jgi:hypothetical protein
VTSADEAVARITAERPDLAGIGPFDPDLIGACCWYEATEKTGAFQVVYRVGWGDCPAGCIDQHTWTFRVSTDGAVELLAEGGSPLPSGQVPAG